MLKKDTKKLEAAGKEKWEVIKKKVDDGLDDLEKTFNKVRDFKGKEFKFFQMVIHFK